MVILLQYTKFKVRKEVIELIELMRQQAMQPHHGHTGRVRTQIKLTNISDFGKGIEDQGQFMRFGHHGGTRRKHHNKRKTIKRKKNRKTYKKRLHKNRKRRTHKG
jgi:hypothetical protein